MANSTTFTGTNSTPTSVYDTRVLLYYWPISNLSGAPVSGSVSVTLQLSSDASAGTRSDYNLVLFNGSTETYPNVSNWKNLKTNIACASNYEGQSSTTYFYLNNTNFTSQYTFYVNQNITPNFSSVSTRQTFTFDFDIPSEYQDKSLWNGNNIFLGFAPKDVNPTSAGSIYWSTNATATLTLQTRSGIIRYHNGTAWKDCEVYYYNGGSWNLCEPYYHNGSSWKPLG